MEPADGSLDRHEIEWEQSNGPGQGTRRRHIWEIAEAGTRAT